MRDPAEEIEISLDQSRRPSTPSRTSVVFPAVREPLAAVGHRPRLIQSNCWPSDVVCLKWLGPIEPCAAIAEFASDLGAGRKAAGLTGLDRAPPGKAMDAASRVAAA